MCFDLFILILVLSLFAFSGSLSHRKMKQSPVSCFLEGYSKHSAFNSLAFGFQLFTRALLAYFKLMMRSVT